MGLALVLAGSTAGAHPLAPALLELVERGGGSVDVRFKTTLFTRSRRVAEMLQPRLPQGCERRGESRFEVAGTGRIERFTLACAERLVGARVGVAGLAENGIDALLRVELADGRTMQRVVRPGDAAWTIPARPSRWEVFHSYGDMGVRHIFSGLDHLLFVFGLVLLVEPGRGYLRRLLITLSAFTVGHCVTLSLAALEQVRLPGPPVEFAIALSVLLLAVELARGADAARRARLPWALAGGFGLLHGLGFAGALLEAGLPEGEVLVALLAFNVGIELGQVAFVLIVLAGRAGLRLLTGARPLPGWTGQVPVYGMGTLAAMWCFERAVGLLS